LLDPRGSSNLLHGVISCSLSRSIYSGILVAAALHKCLFRRNKDVKWCVAVKISSLSPSRETLLTSQREGNSLFLGTTRTLLPSPPPRAAAARAAAAAKPEREGG
jgi:hypothetical protein